MGSFDITGSLKSFIIIKGVCNFTGDNTKVWEPTAALAANDYLYHHLYQTDLSLLVEGMCILRIVMSNLTDVERLCHNYAFLCNYSCNYSLRYFKSCMYT